MGRLECRSERLQQLGWRAPNPQTSANTPTHLCSPHSSASQKVAELISQCMALEPRERPTAQQLLAQLEELAARSGSARRLAS